ncbi:NAD(P)H-dependent oxidoreductase [Neobacillus cucumis]|uniref:NAD(P)H-dependent oxidoreductase n=1 Tax=Neobacillus cucumis TaxID=1740721 RepID=UPI0020405DE7|nr:NAD(P)H-dependent oxidoreductase [Neobacillus cucumis]MCM3729965.1 NAD(P)H-dependent oxidoreductase [Neobacillus cucumis]
MKILIVYDSEGGHTKALAQTIAAGAELTKEATVIVKNVKEADVRHVSEMDAIIWGCPGHFGTISSGLKEWIDKLGFLWAEGKLVDKVGAVFCTTATTHGGLEATLLNLITPMFHHGMIIAGLPGNIPENALYGSYYGLGIACPVESNQQLSENDIALGKALGQRVVRVTQKFTQSRR